MIKYEPWPMSSVSLPYPHFRSEFEIQSNIFQFLKSQGLDVRGEVILRTKAFETRKTTGSSSVRIDIAVFGWDSKLRAIIEVKNSSISRLDTTRQGQRYRSFGVPVFLVWEDDPDTLRDLLNELSALN